MRETAESVLAVVIETIRTAVNEDWIEDFEIGPETRLSADLDLESIEFVKVAEALQARFAGQVDLIGWLSGKTPPELAGLDVGTLAAVIAGGSGVGAEFRSGE